MSDLGYFSDTDDSAVEELISQAKDLSALEQVAKINCSSFTDSSTLPDDLEARFRRLKTIPASKPGPDPVKHQNPRFSRYRQNPGNKSDSVCLSDTEPGLGLNSGIEKDLTGDFSNSRESKILSPVKKNQKVTKRRTGSSSSIDFNSGLEKDLTDSRESKILSPVKTNRKLLKRTTGSSSSIDLAAPVSSDSEPEIKSKPKSTWFNKLSPSKLVGYIFRSPKKSLTKKKDLKSFKDSGGRERDIDDFDEFLSDLNAYSMEDQRKMLKKALKEQQKMRKEAAEIIKMAKQASAKFDFDD